MTNQQSNKLTRIKERIRKTMRNYAIVKSKRCNTIMSIEHYNLFYKSAFFFLLPTIVAIYNGYYFYSLIPFGVFLTSTNYWRYPVRGWRRNIDIIWVFFAITYGGLYAYHSENGDIYFTCILIVIIVYIFSEITMNYNYNKSSSLLHSCAHLFGSIGQVYMFSGFIPQVPLVELFT